MFHNDQPLVTVDGDWIEKLKRAAADSPNDRARLCLHRSPEDPVQEMIIAFCEGSRVPPHRHPGGGSESFHVIEGALTVVIFDDSGGAREHIELSAGSGGPFAYRLCAPLWHTVIPRSQFVVVHEVTCGPFNSRASEFPDWLPDAAGALETFWTTLLDESGARPQAPC